MNFDTTIRELEEKRDFYAAAITALKKIAVHETAKATAEPTPRKKRKALSAETKARMAEGQRVRWERHRAAQGNGVQPHADQVQ